MHFTKAIVVRGRGGPDKVTFDSTLPSGVFPFTGTQDFNVSITRNTAEEYLKAHFPELPYEVISCDSPLVPFSEIARRAAGWS